MKTLILAILITGSLFAQAGNFILPASGICGSDHCDQANDQNATAIAAPASASFVGIDNSGGTIGAGIGCTTNGTYFACKVAGAGVGASRIRVYSSSMSGCGTCTGPFMWSNHTAGVAVDSTVSVPIMAADGSVLFADDNNVTRLTGTGTVAWSVPAAANTGGGQAIKVTPNGDYITVIGRSSANGSGCMQTYAATNGAQLGSCVFIGGTISEYFINTNDVAGIPGSAQGGTIGPSGTMQVLYYTGCDVIQANPNCQLFSVWIGSPSAATPGVSVGSQLAAQFWGPSEASPMWAAVSGFANGGGIFFDTCGFTCNTSGGPGPGSGSWSDAWPTTGAGGLVNNYVITSTVPSAVTANFPLNPYASGCYFNSYLRSKYLDCRNLSNGLLTGGVPAYRLDMTGIIPGNSGVIFFASGDKSITTDGAGHMVIILGIQALISTTPLVVGNGYVVALRWVDSTYSVPYVLWYYALLSQPNDAPTQFPLLNGTSGTQTCFGGKNSGPQCIGGNPIQSIPAQIFGKSKTIGNVTVIK